MNEIKKKELMQKLTSREVIDEYEDNKGKRRIIFVLILLIIVGLIVFHNINKANKLASSKYEMCKLDDCKTFSKTFIKEVRYGYTSVNDDTIYYNCGISKEVDSNNKKCYKDDAKKECSTYGKAKKYCYAFTKNNVKKEKYLYFINPTDLSGIDKFTSLEAIYIDVDDNLKDINDLFNRVTKLTKKYENVKIYIFINRITGQNVKNISGLDDIQYNNINVCLFDKELCIQSEIYSSLNDAIKAINSIKEVESNLNAKFDSPTIIQKAIFVYDYIINNYKVDKNASKEETSLTDTNFSNVENKKTINYLITNKIGSHHALATYYKAILNYMGIDANVVSTTNLKNKSYHDYNQIRINGIWYNTDISLDIINKVSNKYHFEYFLKSDGDFKHDDYNVESKKNTSTQTYDTKNIAEIINNLK